MPTAFSTDDCDDVDPARGESVSAYRGRRRREADAVPATGPQDTSGTEPTVPVVLPPIAPATILPEVVSAAPAPRPRYLTRAEAKAAARAAERRRSTDRRVPAAPTQLRTPLRTRTAAVDGNARRAPQRLSAAAPRPQSARRHRGLAALAAVAAVGALGAVASAAGALPSEASDQPASGLGPQAAAAVGVLHSRSQRSTEQSSATIAGDFSDKAFRMVAVSRSQERGPIAGCDGREPTQHYANGQLPASVLCTLPFAPGHKLRADAAVRLIRLNEVYKGTFGVDLCLTDSYRSLASQYSLAARKPGLAARPGTSEHGWGLAVDVCGGPDQVDSARRAWFLANAPAFGWDNPDWARPGGSKPEPWHWEFVEGE